MKIRVSMVMLVLLSMVTVAAEGNGSGSLELLSADYEKRLKIATDELVATRESIGREKIPLANEIRDLEDQLIKLNYRIDGLEKAQADSQNEQSELESQLSSISKNLNYSVLLAQELAATLEASMLPGESNVYGDILEQLKSGLEKPDNYEQYQSSRETFDVVLTRIKHQIGGSTSDGLSMMSGSSEICEGKFLHFGPVTYFRDNLSGKAGMTYLREGALIPITHPLKEWSLNANNEVFAGQPGYLLVDATGGQALHLLEARGSPADHLKKGGVVGYVIIALGIVAFLTAMMKLWDLRQLSVDDPKRIRDHIEQLNHNIEPVSTGQLKNLKQSCRELFLIAINHRNKPRDFLEEIMYAYILLQRNLHERKLPMLRVIASAAPLLGLLGTVVGMIKTFTLITVVGTGNAAKLSSGISEALVTTELGLIVAIPTLITYGYLSHQTEKRLSLLEQYSVELVNTLQWIKVSPDLRKAQTR